MSLFHRRDPQPTARELARLEEKASAAGVPRINFNVDGGNMVITISPPLSLPVSATMPLLDFFDLSSRASLEWNKALRGAQELARQQMASLTPEQLAELQAAHNGRG